MDGFYREMMAEADYNDRRYLRPVNATGRITPQSYRVGEMTICSFLHINV